jgi:hypothetical protein
MIKMHFFPHFRNEVFFNVWYETLVLYYIVFFFLKVLRFFFEINNIALLHYQSCLIFSKVKDRENYHNLNVLEFEVVEEYVKPIHV